MQATKGLEELIDVFHVKAGPIIPDIPNGVAVVALGSKLDGCGWGLAGVFPGVVQQVVHHARQQAFVALEHQAIFDGHRH